MKLLLTQNVALFCNPGGCGQCSAGFIKVLALLEPLICAIHVADLTYIYVRHVPTGWAG
jgi:hypothetical protein